MIRTLLTLGVLVIGTALAERETKAEESSGYKCTIKHSLELGDDGSPRPHSSAEAFRNMEFIVDRTSGRLLGDISSQWWRKHEILDRGSDQQSYKVIYITEPTVHVNLLQVQEFQVEAVKPFLLVNDTDMHTGTCTALQ
jgi:hypothetical protein